MSVTVQPDYGWGWTERTIDTPEAFTADLKQTSAGMSGVITSGLMPPQRKVKAA